MDAERLEGAIAGIIIPAPIRTIPFLFLFRFKRGTVWMTWDALKLPRAIVFTSVVYRRKVRQKFIVLMDPSIFRDFSKRQEQEKKKRQETKTGELTRDVLSRIKQYRLCSFCGPPSTL
jgi:hypothetical protein